MDQNIHTWFDDIDNVTFFRTLQNEMNFKENEGMAMTGKQNNIFEGLSFVVTGKLEHFTRGSINTFIVNLGGTVGSSVTKKTDYLVCGEKAGSKLEKAKNLGIPILAEKEFLEMSQAH